jgi:hypothetical protein
MEGQERKSKIVFVALFMFQQLSLVPSGVQPWFRTNVIAVHHPKTQKNKCYIGYCSTLSLHRLLYVEGGKVGSKGGSNSTLSRASVTLVELITPFEQNICAVSW